MMRSKVILAVVAALVAGVVPSVARADPAITYHPVTSTGALPFGATSGPDGNIWVTELLNSAIAKTTTDGSATVTEYPTKTQSQPFGIAPGHDGNMWFTEIDKSLIGRSTTTGQMVEFPTTTMNAGPAGMTAGPDGNMWFTEAYADKIGKITPDGKVTEYPFAPLPPNLNLCRAPHAIVTGPDGNLWFTESSNPNCQAGPQSNTCGSGTSPCGLAYQHIGRITPTGSITEYKVPTTDALPFGITVGPDNNMWFTEFTGNNIGRFSTSDPNTITEFTLGTPNGTPCTAFNSPASCVNPEGITSGQDGALWFAENGPGALGRIRTTAPNTITETPLTDFAIDVTAGSDGNVWFTAGNNVGQAVPAAIDHNLAGAVGGNNALFVKPDNGDFQPLDGLLLGAPAVVSVPDNTGASTPLYVAVGGDHRLYVRNASAGWKRLVTPEQQCYDNPAAAVTGPSGGPYLLTVVCQGGDQGLYYWQSPVVAGSLPTIATSFQSLGGKVLAGPAVAPINGVLTFFAEGLDHYIYSRTADPASVYAKIPAACIGHPAVSSNGMVAYAACQGLDGQLYYSIKFGTAPWAPFRSGGGQLIDGPGISLTPTRATFYVEGANQHLFHRSIHLNDGTLASPYVDDGGIIQYGAGATALLLAPS